MVKLLGLLRVVPKGIWFCFLCFVLGFSYGLYDTAQEKQEKYIEELQAEIQARDFKINSLIEKLADDNTKYLALDERFKRLQSSNDELKAKLNDDSYRIANDKCRALLSECASLNGRSAKVQQEGVGLVRTCERKLEVIKGLQ